MLAPVKPASQTVQEAINRANRAGKELNAFITVLDGYAAEAAARVETRLQAGEELPLALVPVVIKDNLSMKGVRTTAASKMLSEYVPPFTATVVERLEAAGAVPIAKANMDEFAMGSSNESSYFGPVKNPHDQSRVPGGSSGGSAAAVAAGIVPLALGSDTGGSVRQPASFCGILGLKPGYGRLSRYGALTLAMSFDQVGMFARTTGDLRLALAAMDGPDEHDSVTVGLARRPKPKLPESIDGLKIGMISELSGDWNAEGVRSALDDTVTLLRSWGAQVSSFSLASFPLVAPTYLLLCSVEASSALARFDGMTFGAREGGNSLGQERVMQLSRGAGLGDEVRRRVLIGSLALSEEHRANYHDRAVRARGLIKAELAAALGEFDMLLTPTTPSGAWELGIPPGLRTYRGDTATNLANLAGLPAISVPGARAEQGLPIGMQVVAPSLREDLMFEVGAAIEELMGFTARPTVGAEA